MSGKKEENPCEELRKFTATKDHVKHLNDFVNSQVKEKRKRKTIYQRDAHTGKRIYPYKNQKRTKIKAKKAHLPKNQNEFEEFLPSFAEVAETSDFTDTALQAIKLLEQRTTASSKKKRLGGRGWRQLMVHGQKIGKRF